MPALCLDVTVTAGARRTRRTVRLAAEVGYGELAVARTEPDDGAAITRAVAIDTPPGSVVEVGGADVTQLPPEERKIGYVPAGGGLFPQLSIRRNITYGLGERDIAERFVARRLDQASEQLGLGLVLDLRPHEVTEDERLRAALARAAVQLPEVLVVDLPEALVDDGTGVRVKPLPLAELVRAASLSRHFDVAALVCSSDPRAVSQVSNPLMVDRLDARHPGRPTADPPSPAATPPGKPGGPPTPGAGTTAGAAPAGRSGAGASRNPPHAIGNQADPTARTSTGNPSHPSARTSSGNPANPTARTSTAVPGQNRTHPAAGTSRPAPGDNPADPTAGTSTGARGGNTPDPAAGTGGGEPGGNSPDPAAGEGAGAGPAGRSGA